MNLKEFFFGIPHSTVEYINELGFHYQGINEYNNAHWFSANGIAKLFKHGEIFHNMAGTITKITADKFDFNIGFIIFPADMGSNQLTDIVNWFANSGNAVLEKIYVHKIQLGFEY